MLFPSERQWTCSSALTFLPTSYIGFSFWCELYHIEECIKPACMVRNVARIPLTPLYCVYVCVWETPKSSFLRDALTLQHISYCFALHFCHLYMILSSFIFLVLELHACRIGIYIYYFGSCFSAKCLWNSSYCVKTWCIFFAVWYPIIWIPYSCIISTLTE